jgi:hypothetical protein
VAASYVADLKDVPCSQHTLITALECLRRDSDDSFAPLSHSGGAPASTPGVTQSSGGGNVTATSSESCNSLPVVGTESGHVYILASDCSGSAAICSVQLPSVPAIMCPVGRFDAEWRCVSCSATPLSLTDILNSPISQNIRRLSRFSSVLCQGRGRAQLCSAVR